MKSELESASGEHGVPLGYAAANVYEDGNLRGIGLSGFKIRRRTPSAKLGGQGNLPEGRGAVRRRGFWQGALRCAKLAGFASCGFKDHTILRPRGLALAAEISPDTRKSGALGALIERRWLLLYFTQRQLTQSYRGSFLGFSWLVLGPLIMVALYTLIFSEIVGLRFQPTEGASNYGLYLYCGLLPFLAFSETASKSTMSIRGNRSLVKKVVFPLEILPLSTAATAFITQLFGFAALIFLVLLFEGGLQWTLLLLPLIAIPQLMFMVGVGCLMSVAGAYLPDLREAISALVRVMLFATPIIWPAELAYENGLGFIVDYNPLAILVEGYRGLVLDGNLPDMLAFSGFSLFALALLVIGGALFIKAKRHFADMI